MTSKQTGIQMKNDMPAKGLRMTDQWGSDRVKRVLACLVCGAVMTVVMLLPLEVLHSFFTKQERSLRDYKTANDMRLKPREDFVFLGIDAASMKLDGLNPEVVENNLTMQRMGQRWPWDRRVYADVIDKLAKAGAKLIIIDLVFDQLGTAAEDEAFAAAIRRYSGKVVLTSAFVVQASGAEKKVIQVREPNEILLGKLEDETPFGYANYWPHFEDGIIRRVKFINTLSEANDRERHPDDYIYFSLSVAAAKQLGREPSEKAGNGRFRMARIHGENIDKVYQPVSLYKIFVEHDWQKDFQDGAFFRDKIVMIGSADPLFHDKHDTTAGKIDGPQLHLHVLGAILDDAWYQEGVLGGGHLYYFVLSLSGVFVACLIVSVFSKPTLLALSLLGSLLFWYIGVSLIHQFSDITMGAIPWVYTVCSGILGSIIWQAMIERARRQELYRHLQRSMSPDVADAIVKAPEGYYAAASGNRKQVTVLFADVRGFTERSENQDPVEMVSQLNEYLGAMVEEIFAHGGSVDKFIGDAIMATWGGLDTVNIQKNASDAVSAALGMLGRLKELNREWQNKGMGVFKIGIGIHHGEAVVGEVGSNQRTDFTVIGDAVNLASRIEGLTKMMELELLLSASVTDLMTDGSECFYLGDVRVKGRENPVSLFTPMASVDNDVFNQALTAFQTKNFDGSRELFIQMTVENELYGLSQLYLRQLQRWQKAKTPSSWDGVLEMEGK